MKKFIVFVVCAVLIGGSAYSTYKAREKERLGWEQKLNELTAKLEMNRILIENLNFRLKEAESKIKEWNAVASWYGPGFHGRVAADGSIYDQNAYTVAHKTLPFGTMLVLEANGNRIPVVVTDRGPYIKGRDLDLSYATAKFLGIVKEGVVPVKVYEIFN